jgi:hypothetical protein
VGSLSAEMFSSRVGLAPSAKTGFCVLGIPFKAGLPSRVLRHFENSVLERALSFPLMNERVSVCERIGTSLLEGHGRPLESD